MNGVNVGKDNPRHALFLQAKVVSIFLFVL